MWTQNTKAAWTVMPNRKDILKETFSKNLKKREKLSM
jgi:hypothetical protein